ncbi:MAG TPA: FHA domain-containing protein [bacterium]|nr:FHA domain-containing protein [bacterium]
MAVQIVVGVKTMKGLLEVIHQGRPTLRFEIADDHSVVVGRTEDADWVVPDEKFLSHRHVELRLKAGRLIVKRLKGSSNPIFHQGHEKESFFLESGDQFVVGKTRFLFSALNLKSDSRSPSIKLSISPKEIYQGGSITDRLRILDLVELPEILRLKSGADSFSHIASLLRTITEAAWCQIMTAGGKFLAFDAAVDKNTLKTSRKLVEEALKAAPQPILYCWGEMEQEVKATFQEGVDWAVCAASNVQDEEPILFYVAGEGGTPRGLRDNCRLVGLIADMVGRSLSLQRLEGLKERLEHFFSGQVVSKIMAS